MNPTTIIQRLAGGADVAIVFGLIRKTLGTKERAVLAVNAVPGAHIRSDVPIRQPFQNLPVAISRVRPHGFWRSPLPLREAAQHLFCGHGLLTHPGSGRLYSHDYATVIVD